MSSKLQQYFLSNAELFYTQEQKKLFKKKIVYFKDIFVYILEITEILKLFNKCTKLLLVSYCRDYLVCNFKCNARVMIVFSLCNCNKLNK